MTRETPIIGGSAEKEEFTPVTQTAAMGTSVGLPDESDIENIRRAIKQYELAKPGEIKRLIRQTKADQKLQNNEFASNAKSHTQTAKVQFRKSLTLPIGLYRMIDESYPLMFTDKRHLHWFMRKFPEFNVAKRI